MPRRKVGPVERATDNAIREARKKGILGVIDGGAVAALRAVSRKIDVQDDYFKALADDAAEHNGRPPSMDNVSLPTYLKFCESLGLSPAGRKQFNAANKPDKPAVRTKPATAVVSKDAPVDELAKRRGWRTA